MIEIKKGSHPKIEERIIEIIRSYDGPICLKAFEIDSIKWIKENAPYIKYGLIGSNLDLSIDNLIELGIDFLSYDINFINDPIVKLAQNNGIPVVTWTINTEEKYKKAKKLADNIIFENISI
jgi:glycerophosphoryl diester phosphodiesterase